MHALGYLVSTALAPKGERGAGRLLYTAHDYVAHGRYADRVVLMTYEVGLHLRLAAGISPVNRIRRVLDYAVTVMPVGKILMGFSNYAYDWLLPWRQGQAARILSNAAAVELAISRGADQIRLYRAGAVVQLYRRRGAYTSCGSRTRAALLRGSSSSANIPSRG